MIKCRKLAYVFMAMILGLTIGVGLINPFQEKFTFAQAEIATADGGYITQPELVAKYVNKSNTWSVSDKKLPEFYTFIDGNVTEHNKSKYSSEYDAYMLYVQDQADNGLCWAFTSSQTLATTILKENGEYIDFSEAWISTVSSAVVSSKGHIKEIADYFALFDIETPIYWPGYGGTFHAFDLVARNLGLVLEQDYDYAQSYLAEQETTNPPSSSTTSGNCNELAELYSKYASKNFMKDYISVEFTPYNNKTESEATVTINSIKKHILNCGGLYSSMRWGGTNAQTSGSEYYQNYSLKIADSYVNAEDKQTIGNHAVTLIGWDDSYNGGEGAWIGMNSYGHNSYHGLVYIEFDDSDLTGFYGFEYNPEEYAENYLAKNDNLALTCEITNSNAKGIVLNSGVKTAQKNIFYQCSNVNLEYAYSLSAGAKIDSVKLFFQNEDISKKIPLILNETQKTFSTNFSNLRLGSYKFVITYSDNDQTKTHISPFIVTNGLEFKRIDGNKDSQSKVTNGYYQQYNTYALGDKPIAITSSVDTGSARLSFYDASYSNVYSIKWADESGTHTSTKSDGFSYITLLVKYDLTGVNHKNYVLTIEDSTKIFTKTMNVVIVKVQSSQKVVWFNYELDGGVNPIQNVEKMAMSSSGTTEIAVPTKFGYKFLGWYYDSEYTDPVQFSNNAYHLNYSKTVYSINSRYAWTLGGMYGNSSRTMFLYAKWEEVAFSIIFNTNKGSEIESILVNKGTVISLTGIKTTRVGYDFGGWYKNKELTTRLGNNEVMPNYNLILYAKWTVSRPQNVRLTGSRWVEVNKDHSVELSFTHLLKDDKNTIISVKWFKNSQLIIENSELTFNDYCTEMGNVEYYAEIKISFGSDESVWVKSNKLSVLIVGNVNAIEKINYNGNGEFSWLDNVIKYEFFDETYYANYIVTLYKVDNENSILEKKTISYDGNNSININWWNKLQAVGVYRVGVVKKVGELITKEAFSNNFEIVSLAYSCDTSEGTLPQKQFYDINSYVEEPAKLTKKGYSLDGWYVDSNFKNKISKFPYQINHSGNNTLYAKWKLNDITYTINGNLNGIKYDGNKHNLSIDVNHELPNLKFKYGWIRNGMPLSSVTGNKLSITSCKENGDYVCTVTAVDLQNREAIKNIRISVNLEKADTLINVDGIVKQYTYNGKERCIESGAQIVGYSTRLNEDKVKIEYRNNTFTNVPENGWFELIVYVPASVNYASAQELVKIYVNKEKPILQVGNQVLTYNGQPLTPNGVISNNEQQLIFEGEDIINVGTYVRRVVAVESANYLQVAQEVEIIVNPAKIEIKAKDITGWWLIGKKSLQYEVVNGEQFADDNLNVELKTSANMFKPGEYVISISAQNNNYEISVIEGTYTVTITPFVIFTIITILIGIGIALLFMFKPYVVELKSDGSPIAKIQKRKNSEIYIETPIKNGYNFDGWYTDVNFTNLFDGCFRKIRKNTLYAKWVVDKNVVKVKPKIGQITIEKNIEIKPSTQEETLSKIVEPQQVGVEIEPNNNYINDIINKASEEIKLKQNEEDIENIIKKITE